jgi:hypothetical protein
MAKLTSEGKSLSRYNAASFYPEMAILTSNGKSLDRHMAASSILKWQYLAKLHKTRQI